MTMHGDLTELIRVAITLSANAPNETPGGSAEATILTRGGSERHFIRLSDGRRSAVALVQPGGRKLWSAQNITVSETYSAGESSSDSDANREDAIAELSRRLAERIYNRLTEDF